MAAASASDQIMSGALWQQLRGLLVANVGASDRGLGW